jgi:hypothetical protein
LEAGTYRKFVVPTCAPQFERRRLHSASTSNITCRAVAGAKAAKDATREGFAAGLIEDGDAWMQMIENGNETTHTYEIGEAILSGYVPQFEKFQTRFTQLERQEET